MEATAVHPNQSLLEFQAGMVRQMGHTVAYWVSKTDPTRLDWVPGEPGVTKARTLLDQMSELVNINRRQAASLIGQPAPERVVFTDGEEALAELRASSDAFADAILALPPAALDEIQDSLIGPMPLKNLIGICLSNIAYHGGVANAYQLMYGDEEFHIPPSA